MVNKKQYQRRISDPKAKTQWLEHLQNDTLTWFMDMDGGTKFSPIDEYVEETLQTIAYVENMDYEDLIDIDFD